MADLKVPADEASGDYEDELFVVQRGIGEKEAWRRDRAVQGNRTASVVRNVETGGDAAAHIEGTLTPTPGLADLDAAVFDSPRSLERRFGAIYEAGDVEFVFYNVEVVESDLITYEGDTYRAVGGTIRYEGETGRCSVLARLVG